MSLGESDLQALRRCSEKIKSAYEAIPYDQPEALDALATAAAELDSLSSREARRPTG